MSKQPPRNIRHVYLKADIVGRGAVLVDGRDLSHLVSGCRVETMIGSEATTVTLLLNTEVEAHVEAVVLLGLTPNELRAAAQVLESRRSA